MTRKSFRPAERDRLQRRAGLALYQSAPTNGALALALGHRPETTSRIRNGRRPNTISRYLGYIERLAATPECSPWPLITESETVAEMSMMEGLSLAQLEARHHALPDEIAEARVRSDRALRLDDMESLERARLEEAALVREHAAVVRLIRRSP